MKFIIDAQLPPLLKDVLLEKGVDAMHVNDLDHGYLSNDFEISEFADSEERIVITKDSDFYNSHIISNTPKKILIVSTGNIKNNLLLSLFRANIKKLKDVFNECDYVEMSRYELIKY